MSYFVIYNATTGEAVSTTTTQPDAKALALRGLAVLTLAEAPPEGSGWNPATLAYDPPVEITADQMERVKLIVQMEKLKVAIWEAPTEALADLRVQADQIAVDLGVAKV
jgi:hypothetical protein